MRRGVRSGGVLIAATLIAATGLAISAGSVSAAALTLDEAVRIAREQSPTATIARERVAEAAARAGQADAMFFPMLKVTSSYTQSDNPVQVFMFGLNQAEFSMAGDFNNPPTADNWQASLVAQYRLFAGGRDLANRRAAKAAEEGMAYMQAATEDELTMQTTRSYLSVLTAAEFVRAAEAAVRDFEASEKVMTSRVDAGTALRTGLLEIQVQLAQAQERLLQARNGLALAKESLRLVLGLESLGYDEFGVLDDVNLPVPPEDAAGERPEVKARAAFSDAARASVTAAKGGYLPAINAFGSLDRYQGWEFDGTNETWTAGLMLEWSIFDGFLTRSQVREKRAQANVAAEEVRSTQLATSVERTTASLNLRDASQRVEVMQRAVELAREHVALTRQRFDQGLMLPSEVIDAENGLVQAEVGLAQAKADRQYAIAALRRTLGLSITGEVTR